MLVDLIRFLRGYVVFAVSGRFPERFLNIAARNGLRLWRAERSGDAIIAAMYRSDYRRARRLARAAGVRLCVRERCGLPVYVRRYRDRVGIIVGAFVFLLTVFVMSQFVWSIDINGLESISESELRDQLRTHGLYVGAFRPALNDREISRAVMLDNGKVAWMAINFAGSCASVEVREEISPPDVPDIREPANVKARRDGTVLRIQAREGKALVKEGSGVAAGQLIVSGVLENKPGGSRLVRADASILAVTSYTADFRVPESYTLILPDGDSGARRTLSLFGLRIPLSGYASDASYSAVDDRMDSIAALDTVLPVGVVTEHIRGMEEKCVICDENSAKELLMKHARLYEVFTLGGCTVTDRRYSLSHRDGCYILTARYDCEEDIAVQIPIGVEQTAP